MITYCDNIHSYYLTTCHRLKSDAIVSAVMRFILMKHTYLSHIKSRDGHAGASREPRFGPEVCRIEDYVRQTWSDLETGWGEIYWAVHRFTECMRSTLGSTLIY